MYIDFAALDHKRHVAGKPFGQQRAQSLGQVVGALGLGCAGDYNSTRMYYTYPYKSSTGE
jgi:hypothetical protein